MWLSSFGSDSESSSRSINLEQRPCWRAGATIIVALMGCTVQCCLRSSCPTAPLHAPPEDGCRRAGDLPAWLAAVTRLVRRIDATRVAESWKQLLLRCKSFPRNLHPHLQRCKSHRAHPNTAVALFARASPEPCTYTCNAARATAHIRKQLLLRCRSVPRTQHLHLQRRKSRRTHVETAVAPLQQCSQKFRGASCELSGPEAGLTRTRCVKP